MEHIVFHNYQINKNIRNERNGHQSPVIWFTGLSGSGKSTIANIVEKKLFQQKVNVYALDGDNVRTGLNKGLSFTEVDRQENLRRIAEVAKLFADAGMVTIGAFVSPLQKDRMLVRDIVGEDNFIEIFVNTSLEECERRDVKGLYKKARAGEIMNFTGISAPYEAPLNPDMEIKTEEMSIEEAAKKVFDFVISKLSIN